MRVFSILILLFVISSCADKKKSGVTNIQKENVPRITREWHVTGMVSPYENEEIEVAKQLGFS